MTHRDDLVSMRQMLQYAREIREAIESYDREEYFKDRLRELGLYKLFEMVGEAANRVSIETQEQNPHVPWRYIIGARNRLSHGYDSIDQEVVWDAAAQHIPSLIEQLEELVGEGGQ
jgi:uncharacterized protein with HEPN domain